MSTYEDRVRAAPLLPDRGGKKTAGKPWWGTCTIVEFRNRLREMPLGEQETLLTEIKATISHTGAVSNDVNAPGEQRFNARRALAYMGEKRGILVASCSRLYNEKHTTKDQRKKMAMKEAREAMASGNLAMALQILIDYLDKPSTEPPQPRP